MHFNFDDKIFHFINKKWNTRSGDLHITWPENRDFRILKSKIDKCSFVNLLERIDDIKLEFYTVEGIPLIVLTQWTGTEHEREFILGIRTQIEILLEGY